MRGKFDETVGGRESYDYIYRHTTTCDYLGGGRRGGGEGLKEVGESPVGHNQTGPNPAGPNPSAIHPHSPPTYHFPSPCLAPSLALNLRR